MNKIRILIFLAALIAERASAVPVELNKLNDWYLCEPESFISEGESGIKFKHDFKVISKRWFEVRPNLVFDLSAELRTVGSLPGHYIIGFIPYDEEKREIKIYEVNSLSGFDSELYAKVEAGDTVIRIRNPTFAWKTGAVYCVAFNARELFKDQPNRETHTGGIVKVERNDSVTAVTLSKPLKKGYPTGTKLRLHYYGPDFYVYHGKGAGQWKSYGGQVKGVSAYGSRRSMWWVGTKYVRIFLQISVPKKSELQLGKVTLKITEDSLF